MNLSGIVTAAGATVGGGVIQNVESLIYLRGSEFADRITLPTQSVMITVNAGGGDDVITSQGSSASITGGDGSDRLVSGPAADTFDGGSGSDIVDYGGAASGVSVNLRTGAGGGGDTLFSVEQAFGSAFNDTLAGTGNGATLSAGGGADRIEAGARDVVTLGSGADLINVASGTHAAAAESILVTVTDWTAEDRLQFGASTGAYVETTASTYAGAQQAALTQLAAGYNFVAVQVGADVYVFGQPTNPRVNFDDAVRLVGTTLDSVSASNVGLTGPLETPTPPPPPPAPPTPTPPAPPTAGVNLTGTAGNDNLQGGAAADTLTGLAGADVLQGQAGGDILSGGDGDDHLQGGIGADTLSGGAGSDVFEFNLTGDAAASSATGGNTAVLDRILDWSSADFLQFWGAASANAGNYREINAATYDQALSQAQGGFTEFGIEYTVAQVGADVVVFAPRHNQAIVLAGRSLDTISATNLGPTPGATPVTPPPPAPPANTPTAGNDSLTATASNPEIHAGLGNDTISAGSFITYLRGDEGNDSITGGSNFDDINGNMGDDTATGGLGDDWVVGGRDNDTLAGETGSDLVYGNLGNDTCDGGDGADIVRGGQDNDIVRGGAGDDFVSGDKGDDTMTGGAGADIFHTFGESGIDRVTDFNLAQGDKVMLDPGTQFTVHQVGADTVIDMTGGGQVILVGVSMNSLSPGWIFGA